MKMRVTNKNIKVGDVKIESIGPTSVFLLGDSETITTSIYFDTPSDSLIIDPRVPIRRRHESVRLEGQTTDPNKKIRPASGGASH